MKLSKWDPVVVEWLDATGTKESHDSEEFVASYVPMVRRTIGFYLHCSDHGIFITETDDRLGILSEDCENITVIPLSMLRQIEQLGLPVSTSKSLRPAKQSKRL